MNLVNPGRYVAKVAKHAITETKGGDPQAVVRFEFVDDQGHRRELTWFGSFKDKAQPYTIKALINCGLQGNNPAGPLEIGKEVSIVVEIDKDNDGKDRNIVRWVNGLNQIQNEIDPQKAASMLERFSGAVMAAKKEMGVGLKNHAPQSAAKQDEMPDWMKEDIGF